MAEKMSGLQLFLRYAWPCAKGKMLAKKITRKEFERLAWLILDKRDPEPKFLRICFPNAVSDYEKHCAEVGVKPDFSFGSVADYWRFNHKGVGLCAVEFRKVVSVDDKSRKVKTDPEGTAGNIYSLELKIGNIVAIHATAVIEIIRSAA